MTKGKRPTISLWEVRSLPRHCQVRFALFCAKQVLHLADAQHQDKLNNILLVVQAYLTGEATREECRAAISVEAYSANVSATAAAYAANAAAAAAAYAAADTAAAAAAAGYAAWAADDIHPTYREKIVAEQWEVYNDLLNVDEALEKAFGIS